MDIYGRGGLKNNRWFKMVKGPKAKVAPADRLVALAALAVISQPDPGELLE